jgi:hypothetical protein
MISVLYNNSFSGGSITVNAENGCGTGPDRSKTVSRNILKAPANINGLANGVCGSSGVGYTCANVTGATNYLWTVPAGATITSGQGTSTILVSFNGSYTTGAITVAAGNACGYGAVRSMTVSGAPAKADPISGPAVVCTNTVYTYEVAAIPGVSSYNWVVPASVQILSGQGTKTITVRSPLAPSLSVFMYRTPAVPVSPGNYQESVRTLAQGSARISSAMRPYSLIRFLQTLH